MIGVPVQNSWGIKYLLSVQPFQYTSGQNLCSFFRTKSYKMIRVIFLVFYLTRSSSPRSEYVCISHNSGVSKALPSELRRFLRTAERISIAVQRFMIREFLS